MDTRTETRVLSLFSGVSGLGIGVRVALPESRHVLFVEREFEACEVLAARMADGSLDEAPIFTDITQFDGRPWRGRVDVIEGGSPCQDLSVAGKRTGIGGKRSGLWHEYARIIEEVQPEAIIFENVGGILSSRTLLHRSEIMGYFDAVRAAATCPKESWYAERHIERLHRRLLPIHGISALLYVQCCLGELGYESEAGFFTASEVGASHKRERVFIVGFKPGSQVLRQLADGPGGRFDKLWESPRSGGFADGCDGGMENAEHAGPSRWWATAGREAATDISWRSGESELGNSKGNDERRESARYEQRSKGMPITSGGSSGGALADAGDGLIPQPWRGLEGRDGAGPAVEVLADTKCTRREESEHGGQWELREESSRGLDNRPERHGRQLEHATGPRCSRSEDARAGCGDASQDGSAEPVRGHHQLGNPNQPGLEGWQFSGRGLSDERAAGAAGDTQRMESSGDVPGLRVRDGGKASKVPVLPEELANDPQSRSRGIPEPGGRDDAADVDGERPELADTASSGRQPEQDERRICGAMDGPGEIRVEPGNHGGPARERSELADANSERRQQVAGGASGDEEADGRTRRNELEPDGDYEPSGVGTGGLPVFAPGPGATEQWQIILAERPWLAPAISKEETESSVRQFPAWMARLVDQRRTHSLRQAGNGVTSATAALAIVTLARRALSR